MASDKFAVYPSICGEHNADFEQVKYLISYSIKPKCLRRFSITCRGATAIGKDLDSISIDLFKLRIRFTFTKVS